MWTSGKRRALLAVGLFLASVYVAAAMLTDSSRLMDALRQLGFCGCTAILGLSAMNYLLRFFRWQYYLATLGRNLPPLRHLLYYLSGFAFTVSPAKTGEAVRALYLKDHGVTYTESMSAFFVERLLDLFAIVVLAAIMIIGRPAYRPLLAMTATFVTIAALGVCQPTIPAYLDRLVIRLGPSLGRVSASVANLLRSSRRLIHPRPLLFGGTIGLIAWAAEALGFWLICNGMHIRASLLTCIGIYALSVLAGSIAFIMPAGIGGTEIAMTSLLVAEGTILRVAVLATLLCRLATLWFAVLVGVGAASIVELSSNNPHTHVAP